MSCCCDVTERRAAAIQVRHFSGVAVDVTVALGAAVGFLLAAALAADGYFVDHTRYVYEFWTLNGTNATGVGDVSVNTSFFATFDEPLPFIGLNSSTVDGWNGTALSANFTRAIPAGALSNASWTLPVPGYPGVPGVAVVRCARVSQARLRRWRRGSAASAPASPSGPKRPFALFGSTPTY